MCWYPQTLFTTEQICRRHFLFCWCRTPLLFLQACVFSDTTNCVQIICSVVFLLYLWRHNIDSERDITLDNCRNLSRALALTRLVTETISDHRGKTCFVTFGNVFTNLGHLMSHRHMHVLYIYIYMYACTYIYMYVERE